MVEQDYSRVISFGCGRRDDLCRDDEFGMQILPNLGFGVGGAIPDCDGSLGLGKRIHALSASSTVKAEVYPSERGEAIGAHKAPCMKTTGRPGSGLGL